MATKIDILREHLPSYLKSNKKKKGEILDMLSGIIKLHRKSIVRALKREQLKDKGIIANNKIGRSVMYGADVTAALKEVWEIGNKICAERLHTMIREYVEILSRDDMWNHSDEVTVKLLGMSLGTMKNRVDKFMKIKAGGGRSTTKPSDLKEIIPVRRGFWDNPLPGYGEIDTVVHCGPTLSGDMAYTVNYTDIATTWAECAAQINKGQERTKQSIIAIKSRLPVTLLGLDPDSGSEFINWILKGWCDENKVELSRSRPNHKNDNAHIEQKNYTHVRKWLGYSRIDTEETVALMNELYSGPWRLYVNFFQPSMKCIDKVRIGSKYIRKYDKARTPYQRVMEHPVIDQSIKDNLTKIKETLNPLILKKEIDKLIIKIFKTQKDMRASEI